MTIRIGVLLRHDDETGVSGTGIVANVIELPDGTVIARWRSDTPSTLIFANLKAIASVHGHGGKTEVVFYAELPVPATPAELERMMNPPSEEDLHTAIAEEIASEVAEQLEEQVAKKAAKLAVKKMLARERNQAHEEKEPQDASE